MAHPVEPFKFGIKLVNTIYPSPESIPRFYPFVWASDDLGINQQQPYFNLGLVLLQKIKQVDQVCATVATAYA